MNLNYILIGAACLVAVVSLILVVTRKRSAKTAEVVREMRVVVPKVAAANAVAAASAAVLVASQTFRDVEFFAASTEETESGYMVLLRERVVTR